LQATPPVGKRSRPMASIVGYPINSSSNMCDSSSGAMIASDEDGSYFAIPSRQLIA
jgi:hypothetical protein